MEQDFKQGWLAPWGFLHGRNGGSHRCRVQGSAAPRTKMHSKCHQEPPRRMAKKLAALKPLCCLGRILHLVTQKL